MFKLVVMDLYKMKKFLTKSNIIIAFVSILLLLSFFGNITIRRVRNFVRDIYYFHYEDEIWLPKKLKGKELPTKVVQFDNIKYVKIINLDSAKDRREYYERMLRHELGESFLGKKVGDDIRLKGVYGNTDVEFVNLETGEVWDYDKIVKKNGGKWSWQASKAVFGVDTKWIGRVKNDKNVYIKFSPLDIADSYKENMHEKFYRSIFTKFGCHLSHLKAIQEISRLPKGSWGLVLEDDFQVCQWFYRDFKEKILNNVPKDAEMLKLVMKPSYLYYGYFKENRGNIYNSFANKGFSDWLDLKEATKLTKGNVISNGANMISQEGAKKIADFYKNNFALNPNANDYEFFWSMPKDDRIKLRSYQYLPKKRMIWLSNFDKVSSVMNWAK